MVSFRRTYLCVITSLERPSVKKELYVEAVDHGRAALRAVRIAFKDKAGRWRVEIDGKDSKYTREVTAHLQYNIMKSKKDSSNA